MCCSGRVLRRVPASRPTAESAFPLTARYRAGQSPDFAHWGPTTDDLAAESRPDGTLQYRLRSRIDGVADRERVVQLHVDEIVAVLEETADVLTAVR